MTVVTGIDGYRPSGRPVCLALGTFDGLHRGHRAVIDAVKAAASAQGGEAVVTTFHPHPMVVIAPPRVPYLLSTIDERIALFESTGITTLVIVGFDATLREMPAADWLALLESRFQPDSIVVSSTHAFGRNREGTAASLQVWGVPRGINVRIVPPVANGGVVISSTSVRERLREGDVRTAAAWLGRWYSARGSVVTGEGRGRQLGVPTANLQIPAEKIVPAQGVYAAFASVGGYTYQSAVNIGVRPTFGSGMPAIEAHLLDADVQVYGETMELAFVDRLRPERRFPTVDALREQIALDVIAARSSLEINRSFHVI
jgi:riboflavin kinase/FMN adenylyltransferase